MRVLYPVQAVGISRRLEGHDRRAQRWHRTCGSILNETSSFTFAIIVAMIGMAAGLGGMALGMLLHVMQHMAYGYSVHAIISPESFLQGVSAAAPARRVLALSACGLVAGFGW